MKTNIDILDIYMLTHLIFLAALRNMYCLHFTDMETEVERKGDLVMEVSFKFKSA